MVPLFSSVSSQRQSILKEQSNDALTLKQGQVLFGKVKQIFPNQMAEIQLGKHQIIAKIEVPLSTDQSYLFEVSSIGEMPQLKMIQSSNAHLTMRDAVSMMLARLNLSSTKTNQQFIQALIENQIPIRQPELEQALVLLKNHNTQETKSLLIDMLKAQLPIAEVTLDGLRAVKSNQGLVPKMKSFLQTLETSETVSQATEQLKQKLRTILNQGSADQSKDGVHLNQRLTTYRSIPTDFNNDLNNEQNQTNSQNRSILDSEALINQLNKQIALTEKQLFQFNKVFAQFNNQQGRTNDNRLTQLQSLLKNPQVKAKITRLLPSDARGSLEMFIEQPTQNTLSKFIEPLTELIANQWVKAERAQIFELLNQTRQIEPDIFPIRQQFLIHLKDFLLNSGLDYEHNIVINHQRLNEQPISLKQLLLRVYQDQSAQVRETESLLNHLTGQQLTQINEDTNFLHILTRVPGLFGLEEDIKLEFYSQKDQEERIDPDHCRIAFYLELKQLGTTMIDMAVQDRVVHLTVYNEADISESLDLYKNLLKKGLAKLNYHLSTIEYRTMLNNTSDHLITMEGNEQSFNQSNLDVRI